MAPSPRLSSSAQAIKASVFAELAARVEARARAGGDLVPLQLGDTHLLPPEAARFARVEPGAADPALYRYGSTSGLDALKVALAAHLATTGRGPPGIDPGSGVLVGAGATHAIYCALRAILEPGDEVVVGTPYWPLSVGIVRAAGGTPVEVPLSSRLYADPSLDPAALLEAAIGPSTRALYLITPNNPDGYVLSAQQLERIARLAIARDLWVLADEVYADYVHEREHLSIASLPGMAERTLTAYSLSKSHALAGARVGFVVGPEPAVSLARRVSTHTVFNVPLAAQRAGVAALGEGAAWVASARSTYRAARDVTLQALEAAGVRASAPHGGSYVFVDFAPVLGGRPLLSLLHRAIDQGVLLAPGDGFGEGYDTWARLCFTAVSPDRLLEGLRRLRRAIDDR